MDAAEEENHVDQTEETHSGEPYEPTNTMELNAQILMNLDEERCREIKELSEKIEEQENLMEELRRNRDEINLHIHTRQLDIDEEIQNQKYCLNEFKRHEEQMGVILHQGQLVEEVMSRFDKSYALYRRLRDPFDAQLQKCAEANSGAEAVLASASVLTDAMNKIASERAIMAGEMHTQLINMSDTVAAMKTTLRLLSEEDDLGKVWLEDVQLMISAADTKKLSLEALEFLKKKNKMLKKAKMNRDKRNKKNSGKMDQINTEILEKRGAINDGLKSMEAWNRDLAEFQELTRKIEAKLEARNKDYEDLKIDSAAIEKSLAESAGKDQLLMAQKSEIIDNTKAIQDASDKELDKMKEEFEAARALRVKCNVENSILSGRIQEVQQHPVINCQEEELIDMKINQLNAGNLALDKNIAALETEVGEMDSRSVTVQEKMNELLLVESDTLINSYIEHRLELVRQIQTMTEDTTALESDEQYYRESLGPAQGHLDRALKCQGFIKSKQEIDQEKQRQVAKLKEVVDQGEAVRLPRISELKDKNCRNEQALAEQGKMGGELKDLDYKTKQLDDQNNKLQETLDQVTAELKKSSNDVVLLSPVSELERLEHPPVAESTPTGKSRHTNVLEPLIKMEQMDMYETAALAPARNRKSNENRTPIYARLTENKPVVAPTSYDFGDSDVEVLYESKAPGVSRSTKKRPKISRISKF